MYTARFYRRERNDWVYLYSKVFTSINEIEMSLGQKMQIRIYDEFYEKIKVLTSKELK